MELVDDNNKHSSSFLMSLAGIKINNKWQNILKDCHAFNFHSIQLSRTTSSKLTVDLWEDFAMYQFSQVQSRMILVWYVFIITLWYIHDISDFYWTSWWQK